MFDSALGGFWEGTAYLASTHGSIILKEDLKNAPDHHQQSAVFI